MSNTLQVLKYLGDLIGLLAASLWKETIKGQISWSFKRIPVM